jgi:LysM repeat protein
VGILAVAGGLFVVLAPFSVNAGVISDFFSKFSTKNNPPEEQTLNLQNLSLPQPAMNVDPSIGRGGGDIVIDQGALVPLEGPAGAGSDIVHPKNQTISIYVVRPGDTLSTIAEMFEVTPNTIRWANDIEAKGTIRVGQTLTILPIAGLKYTVKKGDTLASIAKKYGGDADEIANYNSLETQTLAVGTDLIIPDGELPVVAPPRVATPRGSSVSAPSPAQAGYYLRPIAGGVRTQGVHGYNAVDLAAPLGTPIVAAADGEVIVARDSGWNGGYGQYIVIRHDNGSQTLYAHESSIIVGVGQRVVRGQVIGYVGQSGKATGPHIHFEIRGGIRNPF